MPHDVIPAPAGSSVPVSLESLLRWSPCFVGVPVSLESLLFLLTHITCQENINARKQSSDQLSSIPTHAQLALMLRSLVEIPGL